MTFPYGDIPVHHLIIMAIFNASKNNAAGERNSTAS
jgi:hypothetical protein